MAASLITSLFRTRSPPGPRAAAGTILRRKTKEQEHLRKMELRRMIETPETLSLNTRLWPHDPDKWVGIEILGQGSFGVASLWEFVGNGSPEDEKNPLLYEQVVLKTGLDHPSTLALYEEGRVQKWLMDRKDTHLVPLVYEFDEKKFDKLYLEFGVHGDLASEISDRRLSSKPYTEMELWKMFHCFAKSCKTLAKKDKHRPLYHMDMKPLNVIISDKPNHDCKGGLHQYKISDFGLAYEENTSLFSSWHWRLNVRNRGTPQYKAPEQWFTDLEFGEKLNVWGVGTIMFQALMLSKYPPPGPRPMMRGVRQKVSYDKYKSPFGSKFIPALGKGFKYGQDLETYPEAQKYSMELRATILHCLMHDPQHRSSSLDLVARIEEYVQNEYGAQDQKHKLLIDEEKRIAKADAREEERKVLLEQRREEDVLAGMTESQAAAERIRFDEEKVEKEDKKKQDKYLKHTIENARRVLAKAAVKYPLWLHMSPTGDVDRDFWINTKTGIEIWDDPYEDPPESRKNRAGQIRDFLIKSPLEQMWAEEYQEYQNQWRRVWKRVDTGEESLVEPDIVRQWRDWHEAYRRELFTVTPVVVPPKPDRQYPEMKESSEKRSSRRFHKPWTLI